jgi:hypothetical protein
MRNGGRWAVQDANLGRPRGGFSPLLREVVLPVRGSVKCVAAVSGQLVILSQSVDDQPRHGSVADLDHHLLPATLRSTRSAYS